ncbi:MAG TPA: TatD family hydrolase [Verrucomicrobiae bacterium]|nr:TatD family hydrolase [Verrucomicrobiae bacterium]
MQFVDTHIHFSDNLYDEYLPVLINVIHNLEIQVYAVAMDLESSAKNIDIKKKYFEFSDLFKTFIGIHPERASLRILDSFNNFFSLHDKNIHGIGEIGLDPTYTLNNPLNTMDVQKIVFNSMLSLAEKNDKPISIHSRRSLEEVLNILTTYRIRKIVFHWFEGSKKLLHKINDLGYYVSFGPYLLYSNDKKALLSEADLSLLMLETDGPVRYKRCFEGILTSPTFIPSLVNHASIILQKSFYELSNILCKNSNTFLNSK